MRPTRQVKIISLHIESLVHMKNELENLLDDVSKLIVKGESWLQGSNDSETFGQINEFLDSEIFSCLQKCLAIAGDKENIFLQHSTREQHNENTRPSLSITVDPTAGDDRYKKLTSLLKKQEEYIETIANNQSNTDAKYNSRFDEIMTELNQASYFIQSQNEVFSNKVKKCEQKCDSQNDELWKRIQAELKINSSNLETLQKQFGDNDKKIADQLNLLQLKSKQNDATYQNANTNLQATEYYDVQLCQVLEGAEVDLLRIFSNCDKNPGHTKFIPVKSFVLNHLPEGHRDKDLYEFIKATADLTVRVDVKMTSRHRLGTKFAYPFHNQKDVAALRVGSGFVTGVTKFTQGQNERNKYGTSYKTCICRKCQYSDSPSVEWWEITVRTSSAVVFDEYEAMHTSLRFFYDSDEGPVVISDQVISVYKYTDNDTGNLHCVICDKHLGTQLQILIKHFDDFEIKVFDKYRMNKEVDKFNFIVSHPHGCSKQISFGQWVEKYKEYCVDENTEIRGTWNSFSYTTCTCPGSSGAPVYIFGPKKIQLVHSRTSDCGLKYSEKVYGEY